MYKTDKQYRKCKYLNRRTKQKQWIEQICYVVVLCRTYELVRLATLLSKYKHFKLFDCTLFTITVYMTTMSMLHAQQVNKHIINLMVIITLNDKICYVYYMILIFSNRYRVLLFIFLLLFLFLPFVIDFNCLLLLLFFDVSPFIVLSFYFGAIEKKCFLIVVQNAIHFNNGEAN